MSISAVQQSDTFIYIHTFYFNIHFHYSLSQDIECRSLCYRVGPCCLFILKVSLPLPNPELLAHSFPFPLPTTSLISVSVSLFLLCVCMHTKSLQSCPTLCDPMDCSLPGSSVQGDSPGKSTGVGCLAFLKGIFPTQGSNPCLLCLLHWQASS